MREFVRDLILRMMEKSRHEISLGVQDAVIPQIQQFLDIILSVAVAASVIVAIAILMKIMYRK